MAMFRKNNFHNNCNFEAETLKSTVTAATYNMLLKFSEIKREKKCIYEQKKDKIYPVHYS